MAPIGRAGLLQLPHDSGQPTEFMRFSERPGATRAASVTSPESEGQAELGAHETLCYIPTARLVHPLPSVRFDAMHPR